MLEEEVVLVRCTTDASENIASHKMIRVRPEAINNLYISDQFPRLVTDTFGLHRLWKADICFLNVE